MNKRGNASLVLVTMLAAMLLTGCGYQYKCGITFGASSCTPSGGGIGSNGNGQASATAFFVAHPSGAYNMGEVQLSVAQGGQATLTLPASLSLPSLPNTYTSSGLAIANKQFLYVPFGGTNQLFAWAIDSTTGNLTALTGSPFAAPWASGIVGGLFVITNPIITNPTGTLLFIADTADQAIVVFQIDPSTGLLTPAPGSPFLTGGVITPWNLAIDGQGRFLYVMEGNDFGEGQKMAVLPIGSSGTLTTGTLMSFPMWQAQGDPSGQFLFGASGETGYTPDALVDQNIHVFTIDQTTGVLTEVAPFPTVARPTSVIVHPNLNFVYSFGLKAVGGGDGPIEAYQYDTTTGALTAVAGSPFNTKTIPYAGFFDQSGAFLFVHAPNYISVFNVDTTTGIPSENVTGVQIQGSNFPWAVTDAQ